MNKKTIISYLSNYLQELREISLYEISYFILSNYPTKQLKKNQIGYEISIPITATKRERLLDEINFITNQLKIIKNEKFTKTIKRARVASKTQ